MNSKRRYTCNWSYAHENGGRCFDIAGPFLDEPLTATVLRQLDFVPLAEETLGRLESDNKSRRLDEVHLRQQMTRLEEEVRKWQALLPGCVDAATGTVDRQKEDFYWEQIRETQNQLEDLKKRPVSEGSPVIDYARVRDFLKGLHENWDTYSTGLRNRLLKLIIEAVELRVVDNDIEATIIWKTGFRQMVSIHIPRSNSKLERRWTKNEDKLLNMLYPSSPALTVIDALPNRNWKAITMRAGRLKLVRKARDDRSRLRRWTGEDEEQLKNYCQAGLGYKEIAASLGRSDGSIRNKIRESGLAGFPGDNKRSSRITWEACDLMPSHTSSSRGG